MSRKTLGGGGGRGKSINIQLAALVAKVHVLLFHRLAKNSAPSCMTRDGLLDVHVLLLCYMYLVDNCMQCHVCAVMV